jgi:hypothetical protein
MAHLEQMCGTAGNGGLLLDASRLDRIRTILPPLPNGFGPGSCVA